MYDISNMVMFEIGNVYFIFATDFPCSYKNNPIKPTVCIPYLVNFWTNCIPAYVKRTNFQRIACMFATSLIILSISTFLPTLLKPAYDVFSFADEQRLPS